MSGLETLRGLKRKENPMKTRYGPHGISGALIRACFGITSVKKDVSPAMRKDQEGDARIEQARARRPPKVKSSSQRD
jgi:hypothetical protein